MGEGGEKKFHFTDKKKQSVHPNDDSGNIFDTSGVRLQNDEPGNEQNPLYELVLGVGLFDFFSKVLYWRSATKRRKK